MLLGEPTHTIRTVNIENADQVKLQENSDISDNQG